MPTAQHREPPFPKPAHLPAKTTQTAAKTLPSAPIQPHDPPDALLELAEMRGNEREIGLSVLSPRNYKWVRVRARPGLKRVKRRATVPQSSVCMVYRQRSKLRDRDGLKISPS